MWELIKRDKWILVILFALCFVPLIWFKPGHLITGTDVDFPLYPQERFTERLFTWFPKILSGTDRSNNITSISYFVIPNALSNLGLSTITIEKISYVLWFIFISFSMYFFSLVMFPENTKKGSIVRFSAVLFYVFNLYQVFLWLRLQLAVSALVLFPVYLAVLIGVSQKKIKLSHSLILLTIPTFCMGAVGIQPPLIIALFMCLFLYALFHSVINFRKKSEILKVWIYLLIEGIVFFFASSYWVFPTLSFIFNSGYASASVGTSVYSVTGLLSWVSSVTSFLNVYRLYGDVPWFDGWGDQLYFPEFQNYLNNPILVILSFVAPLMIFSAPLIYKKNKNVVFFTFLTLIMLFFSKGTHDPLGVIYAFFVKYIPFFWVQRAPWQKFTLLTIIGYSFLWSMSVGAFYEWLYKNTLSIKSRFIKYFDQIFVLILIVFILGYNFTFTLGQMFPDNSGEVGYHRKFNLGFQHTFPDYLFTSREFINNQNNEFKILELPDDKTAVYKWGYAGASDIVSLLFNKGTLSRQYGEGFAPPSSIEQVYDTLINAFHNSSNIDLGRILGMLNIKYIMLRNDFNYNFFGDTDSPELLRTLLSTTNVKRSETFGEWEFFEIPEGSLYPEIYAVNNPVIFDGDIRNLVYVFDYEKREAPFTAIQFTDYINNDFYVIGEKIEAEHHIKNLSWNRGWAWPSVNVDPNSVNYQLVKLKELVEYSTVNDPLKKTELLIWFGAKRVSEMAKFSNANENLFNAYINDYSKVFEIILGIPDERRDDKYWETVRKLYLYTERAHKELPKQLNVEDSLYLFEEIKSWITEELNPGCTTYCFDFNVVSPGEYEVLTHGIDLTESQEATVSINNQNIIFTNQLENQQNWTKLGEIKIDQSEKFLLNLMLPEETNLIPSSEWKKLSEIETEPYDLRFTPHTSFEISFEAGGEPTSIVELLPQNVVYKEINNWQPYKFYNLSFDYTLKRGKTKLIIVEDIQDLEDIERINLWEGEISDETKNCPELENTDSCRSHFEKIIRSSGESIKGYIYLYSISEKESYADINIENLKIQKIKEPKVLLKLKNSLEVSTNQSTPEISFKRINPTKYIVDVKGAKETYDLVFNQSFHTGWKLYKNENIINIQNASATNYFNGKVTEYYDDSNQITRNDLTTFKYLDTIADDSHILVNGFANGWEITPEDMDNVQDYQLIVEFTPQHLFYKGLLVSTLILIVSVAVFIIGKRYEK